MSRKAEKYMLRATLVSLVCNIVLVTIKSSVFLLVGSLAIAVDLGISFVGLLVSIILYYSIKLSLKPADALHNYGYGKVEHVCEILEGVVLIGIAFALSAQAILHFFHPSPVRLPQIGMFSSFINCTINFGGAYYIFKMAKRSASPAIHAEGVHYRLEDFISGIIGLSFLGIIFLRRAGYEVLAAHIDPFAALLVSIIIVVPSFMMAKTSFFKLLDATVEEPSQMEILKILSRHIDKYCEFQDLKSRVAGRKKFVEIKVVLPRDFNFIKAYQIGLDLERELEAGIINCSALVKTVPCNEECKYSIDEKSCPYL